MSPLRRKLHRSADLLLLRFVNALRVLCQSVGLGPLYVSAVIGILKRTRLFDGAFYLSHNEDVARANVEPLRHYVTWGDQEGRWPMPLFDPVHYAAQAGLDSTDSVNRLLHYSCLGRYRGFSPSPWFDVTYYLSHNKDVGRSGIDPLLHYVRWGGKEGRDPSPRFDSDYYLSICPDAGEWGINPLIHYLEQGQYEGRSPLPSPESGAFVLLPPQPTLPTSGDWDVVSPPKKSGLALVDVIVPVYGGLEVTLRCLNSVLRATPLTPHELVVINDASPNRELVAMLQEFADRGLFTLLHNTENQGFVRTANRGISLHPDRDVILLNSDTEVYGNWLDRLRSASRREEAVGTVTPFSNNATICSYPKFLQDNPYPFEIGYEEIDRLAGEANADMVVPAPTGVGFCLYLKRSCLDEVGLFDEEAFGRGYGEENDFCQRALRKGWRNLIACDVFVRHWGSASFQGERARLATAGLEVVKARHPNYQRDIKRFMTSDPLGNARARLDLARLARLKKNRNVLLVTHSRGGGTERHVLEDSERLRALGQGAFVMRPGSKKGQVLIGHQNMDVLPNLGALNLRHPLTLLELLRHLAITEIHIHHIIDFPRFAAPAIQRIAVELNAPIRVMIHDYTAVCPRVNLVDNTGVYCGEPAEQECNSCIARNGSAFGKVNITAWRARYQAFF